MGFKRPATSIYRAKLCTFGRPLLRFHRFCRTYLGPTMDGELQ
jgi:hypothetical protein